MKKIAFLFVAMLAMSFASCNSASKGDDAAKVDSTAVVAAVDSTVAVVDSVADAVVADTALVAE